MGVAAPAIRRTRAGAWAREHLFSTWYNSALTVVFAGLLATTAWRSARFVFVTGRWEVISANLATYMVGLFPRDQYWRAWLAVGLVGVAAGALAGAAAPGARRRPSWNSVRPWWPVALFVAAIAVLVDTLTPMLFGAAVAAAGLAAYAGSVLVPRRGIRAVVLTGAVALGAAAWLLIGVGTSRWGGLLLTLILSAGGIVLSFPIGVALALGRRSSLPVVRWVCVGYIELIRGVPLITLLFMAAFAFGFFMPPGSTPPALVIRALVALVLFTAAYIAEIVRGGLQSVPAGQYEAALALGLSRFTMLRRIVMPQALRAVIPAIVGQFISLFKDTSLVVIIGLTDLLRVAEIATAQPRFLAQGLQTESLVFASFVYWVGAYSMSKASQRLERRLGVGVR